MIQKLFAQKETRTAMFENKRFDVEHALAMHAHSYVHFPAFGIYDKAVLSKYEAIIRNCHIYIIGLLPIINIDEIRPSNESLALSVSILEETHVLELPIPEGHKVQFEGDYYYLENEQGDRFGPDTGRLAWLINEKSGKLNFDVQYIGQAFGNDGSRNAVDRLTKHETLQKIALQGIRSGYRLELLLLEIQPTHEMISVFNPLAADQSQSDKRITAGTQKLYETTEKERVALYEASLIRYFKPKYNVEFKESFPSTNMKVLSDCYDKDFSAIVAEIWFDDLPYQLFSSEVDPKYYHIAIHNLHKEEDRMVFFSQ